eukprot:m.241269 g.241269  ORF g.241269 m.241269 type:complete len:505 (+) comp15321_c0_seq3:66-1580(+)
MQCHRFLSSLVLVLACASALAADMSCDAATGECTESSGIDYTALETIQPPVSILLTVEDESPFFHRVLESLAAQSYPKDKLTITAMFLEGPSQAHNQGIWGAWRDKHSEGYAKVSTTYEGTVEAMQAAAEAASVEDQRLFVIDSLARFTNVQAIQHLVNLNRPIVAPKLTRQGKWWSNFWGAASGFDADTFKLSEVGYVRSSNYIQVVDRKTVGLFEVPVAFSAVLYHPSTLDALQAALNKLKESATAKATSLWPVSLHLCWELTRAAQAIEVSNIVHYGHLIDNSEFDHRKAHPNMYLASTNPAEWEADYLNEQYTQFKELGFIDGCNDVFRVPFFSKTFAKHLIEECESYGQWSSGDSKDERIQGGYEPVPTQDIHFQQLGFLGAWRHIIQTYLRPITTFHYPGYFLEGRTTLDFVVRYRPDTQASLRPHHDASTVTLNVALNQGGVDYQGGGTRFVRQNCTLTNTEPGWGTLSPGRLTHLHEGLETTEGTRYILVSFIDQN